MTRLAAMSVPDDPTTRLCDHPRHARIWSDSVEPWRISRGCPSCQRIATPDEVVCGGCGKDFATAARDPAHVIETIAGYVLVMGAGIVVLFTQVPEENRVMAAAIGGAVGAVVGIALVARIISRTRRGKK